MKNTYSTSDVAKLIGIHPNTVRLYEDLGLITRPERKENGYRIFTDFHLIQFRIARLAFQVEVLQNGLRTQAAAIAKTCASGDIDGALLLTDRYIRQIGKKPECGDRHTDRRTDYIRSDSFCQSPAPYQKTDCRLLTHYRGYAEKLGAQRASGGKENAGRPPRLHLPGSGTADYHQVSALRQLLPCLYPAHASCAVPQSGGQHPGRHRYSPAR